MIIYRILAIVFDFISSFCFELAIRQVTLCLQTVKHVAETVDTPVLEQNGDIKSNKIAKILQLIMCIDKHN